MEIDKLVKHELPSGTEFITRTLVGNDRRAYRRTILDLQSSGTLGADQIDKMEDSLIVLVVHSLGGSTEDIVNRVGNLPLDDYDFLLEKVNEAVEGLNKKKEVT